MIGQIGSWVRGTILSGEVYQCSVWTCMEPFVKLLANAELCRCNLR